MEIASFHLFVDSIVILSCQDRWIYQLKPKIDGCSEEVWTLEEVIICITCMVVE